MCPTKAGKGFKVVVDGVWYYTSRGELFKMLQHKSGACKFRTIEEINRNKEAIAAPQEKGVAEPI